MPFTPPLIKPLLPPLRPLSPLPYRPPGTNRLPPTQTAPIYQPPDFLPPTGLDLKGTICLYSNAPKWELKKIRYRYPGEAWQEIAGDRFSCQTVIGNYGKTSRVWIYGMVKQCFHHNIVWNFTESGSGEQGPFNLTGKILGVYLDYLQGYSGSFFTTLYFLLETRPNTFSISGIVGSTRRLSENPCYTENPSSPSADSIDKSTNNVHISRHEGETESKFKVFNIFNQEILSITRDVCPEVIVVPERCYFQSENEKLASKINVSFGQSLEIKYNANCATVLLYSYPFPNPIQVYKECSDNPNCPPPKIRFDKKCEEKQDCEQCPKGTASKVLIGSTIACVDKNGCIKKNIKYQPGCNTYDCVC